MMRSFYRYVVFYLLVMAVLAWRANDVKSAVVLVALVGAVAVLHFLLYSRRGKRLKAGELWQPFWVIDLGPFGSPDSLRLPDNLDGQWEAVPGEKVQHVAAMWLEAVLKAENEWFTNQEIQPGIFTIYYRYGENANETPEKYRERIIYEMETERLNYHAKIISLIKQGKLKKEDYISLILC